MSIVFTWHSTVVYGNETDWQLALQNLAAAIESLVPKVLQHRKQIVINMITVDDKQIQELNHKYRNSNKATDVLTFNYYENDESEFRDIDAEIYVSHQTAQRQAKEHNISFENEMILLYIHGILHAMGFDHESSANEAEKMRSEEKRLLGALGLEHITPLTT